MKTNNKRLTMVMEPSFLEKYSKNTLPDDYDGTFFSELSLIKGLRDHFEDSSMAFLTPHTLRSDGIAYELEGNSFVPIKTPYDLSSDGLVIFSVDSGNKDFGFNFLKSQYDTYDREKARFGQYLNPLKSKFSIDKKNLTGLLEDKSHFPDTYDTSSWDNLYDLLGNSIDKFVLKHRMGAEGAQVYLVGSDNIDLVKRNVGNSLDEYVAQQYMEIESEMRLMIFGDEVVASREICQRNHPWDDKEKKKLGFDRKIYEPSQFEIDIALKLHKNSGLRYSAVDFIRTADGDKKILEVNGICPGLYTSTSDDNGIVYDLGHDFASFLHKELK